MDKVHYSSVQCSAFFGESNSKVQLFATKKVKLSACQCRSAQHTTLHCVQCSAALSTVCVSCPLLSYWSKSADNAANETDCSTALHCTALHCTALHCTTLHCTALHCTALHCTALHCTVLHWTALHCTLRTCNAVHWSGLSWSLVQCTECSVQSPVQCSAV